MGHISYNSFLDNFNYKLSVFTVHIEIYIGFGQYGIFDMRSIKRKKK